MRFPPFLILLKILACVFPRGGMEIMQKFSSALGDNEFFSAGFGLIGVGAGLALLRKSTGVIDMAIRKYCTTTIEIPSKDKSFEWVVNWLSRQRMIANKHTMVETEFSQLDTGKIVSKYSFPPATGLHYMFYRGFPIQVQRTRERSMMDMTRGGVPFESLTLTTIGRNSGVFVKILDEARDMVQEENEGKTVTYICSGAEWAQFGYPKKRRPISSVVLKEGLCERVLSDVLEFIHNPQWYIDRGIPYRRGYLLHGPPGCGKSSFITAVAGEIYYNLCVLNLSERGLSDDRLHYLLNTAPPQSIIVLEDIESPLNNTGNSDIYRVSRSGLLNALDGVASSEERIIFMTTNYYDQLDPALVRPGRVDVAVEIGYLTRSQVERFFLRFYPDCDCKMAGIFGEKVLSLGISLSPAQGFLLRHKNSPQSAMSCVEELLIATTT